MNIYYYSIIIKTVARIAFCLSMALLACSAFGAEPLPSPDLSSVNSRYIYMSPTDDGGKSSGRDTVTICLPAGYDSTDRRYPVIYILATVRGDNPFLNRQNDMRATIGYDLAHDQLVHDGLIEPTILVAVDKSLADSSTWIPIDRAMKYFRSGKIDGNQVESVRKMDGCYEFIARTVKPLIDRTYRTRPEPTSTGVAGFSGSATVSLWMVWQHPETFGMGLCQSTPAWLSTWLIDNHTGPIPAVRLWMDAGTQEIERERYWKSSHAMCRKLVGMGFRQNDNLAFYTGHNQGHERFDCNRRLRSALYFLLRTKTPTLTGVEITEMDAVEGGAITLTRPAHVVLETVYDNWFRLTDCTAEFKVANSKIVSLDNTTNELRPKAAGHTTITSSFEGRKVTQQVEVIAPAAQQPCYLATKPVVIDGDLSDWPKLPVLVDKPQNSSDVSAWNGPADLSYRFGCSYDDKFFYVAIQTTDQYLNSVPEKDPWLQDGIEVRIDARPEKERLFGQGKESQDFLLVAMGPAKTGETRVPYDAAKLPERTKAVCIATPTGHNTEIAIPISYLNEKAGKQWNAVRLNVVVNDFDDDYKGFTGNKMWWQADWRTPDSTWGSGTFVRQPAMKTNDEKIANTPPEMSTAKRMDRVLKGLRPRMEVEGAPVRWTLAERMAAYKVPAVSIAIVDGGKVVWAQGFGVKEVSGNNPVTATTLFQAASCSKPVVASAMLRLVDKGKLSLDTNVNNYLTSWKLPDNEFTKQEPVTLRRLANHTAGTTVSGFQGYKVGDPRPTVPEILEGKAPANNVPVRVDKLSGESFRYSGGGFTIIQQLLIDVTGTPFPKLLQKQVLGPLGMKHSTFEQPLSKANVAKAAHGHEKGVAVPDGWHVYPELAAAGLWTTPTDLATWAIAMVDAIAGRSTKFLSQATASQIIASAVPGRSSKERIGLGLFLYGTGDSFNISHGGQNEGFINEFKVFTVTGKGASIMINTGESGYGLVQELEFSIAAEYGWPDSGTTKITVVAVDSAALDLLTGTYVVELKSGRRLPRVVRDGTRLYFEGWGPAREELNPQSPTTFIGARGTHFTFTRDAAGHDIMTMGEGPNAMIGVKQ